MKFRKKRNVDAKQTKSINKLKTQVKSLLKATEIKSKDTQFADQQIPSDVIGAYKFDITDLDVWDTNSVTSNENRLSTREGNNVVINRLSIDAMITLPSEQVGSVNATYDAIVRIIIVHSPASAYADIYEVLQNPTDIFSHLKLFPDNPYRILFDKRYNLQATIPSAISGGTRNATSVEPFRRNVKILLNKKQLGKTGVKVEYGQGNAGQDPVYGGLRMFAISTVDGLTFVKPILSGRVRMRFTDE
jgi:hypothetical protein